MLRWLVVPIVAAGASVFAAEGANGDDLLIVDCALPGQIRQLGQQVTYLSARRPVKTTALDCRVRGGEYAVYDRASLRTALKVWLANAEAGDPEAMTTVGEIFEQGLGVPPDYAAAATWYRRAAQRGFSRAQVNLGHLFEQGLGVPRDGQAALLWYRRAAGIEEAMSLEPGTGVGAGAADEAQDPDLLAGPDITLIEPAMASAVRGLVKVHVPESKGARQIVGRVSAPAGLLTLLINGQATTPNEAGVFRAEIPQSEGDGPVRIAAIDQRGRRADLELLLAGRAANEPPVAQERPGVTEFGSYHALLIGNEEYSQLPDLNTPVTDVERLRGVLERAYGFRATVLKNVTRYEILSALNELRARLTGNDNLLIYYAGHGELDKTNSRGHWLPVDAEPDNTANWLSNVAITDVLNVIRAKQVLLVADSCYSGTLTRSSIARLKVGMTPAERMTWLRLMATKRARLVLTSGGVAPVLDIGGGAHSVFAKALIETLEENRHILPGRSLYQAVTARVAHAAADYEFEQVPEFAPISRAGHEAGDFLLIPQTATSDDLVTLRQ